MVTWCAEERMGDVHRNVSGKLVLAVHDLVEVVADSCMDFEEGPVRRKGDGVPQDQK
jgi:hypothetical protein